MLGRGGAYALPPPFTLFTITYKVTVYAVAERADTLTLFYLYPYVLCGDSYHLSPFNKYGDHFSYDHTIPYSAPYYVLYNVHC
jgi:hypothetical protein